MSRRIHALAWGGRTFLVLALLGALLALPGFPVGAMTPVNLAACGAMAPVAQAEAAPCPGCCAKGAAMSCCTVSPKGGDTPGTLPSSPPMTPRLVGHDLDLFRHDFLSLLTAGFPRNDADALPSRPAATTPLRPRSPAQRRALGCLWLI